MLRTLRLLPAVAFALLATSPAVAQPWVPVGPPGGDVRSLATDPGHPRRLYLGTADGVLYRSDVGGAIWQRLQPGFALRGQSLDNLVVSPSGALLVGYWDVHGDGGGVAVSTDRGATFTQAQGLGDESVRALALSPSDPARAVAGTLSGVFASGDGGLTWRRISPPGHAELRNVESVAIDPRDAGVIYVGTRHLPWKTRDGGATWRAVHAGMIDDSDVFTLTLDSRDPQRVFASACSGLYSSRNAAIGWSKVLGIPHTSRRTRAFAQDPLRPDTLYAGTTEGLWVSEDDAASWRLATARNVVVNALASLADGTLLVGTDGAGVMRSDDRGRTWAAANAGFSERLVSRIVHDPARRRLLVSVSGDRQHGGVLAASTPRGPWTRLGAGLEGREVLALTTLGSTVLAGTDEGLFALRGADPAWLPLKLGAPGGKRPRVADLVATPRGVLLALTAGGVFRSVDAGVQWQGRLDTLAGTGSALAASPDEPLVVLVTRLGMWSSADDGLSWRPLPGPPVSHVNAVAVLPGEPRLILAATSEGLWSAAGPGGEWTREAWGLPHSDITGLVVHPDGRTVYVSDFRWGGVYRTLDRGRTWQRLPDDGLVSDRVWTLGLAAPHELLAAARAGGLHLFSAPRPGALASPGEARR